MDGWGCCRGISGAEGDPWKWRDRKFGARNIAGDVDKGDVGGSVVGLVGGARGGLRDGMHTVKVVVRILLVDFILVQQPERK